MHLCEHRGRVSQGKLYGKGVPLSWQRELTSKADQKGKLFSVFFSGFHILRVAVYQKRKRPRTSLTDRVYNQCRMITIISLLFQPQAKVFVIWYFFLWSFFPGKSVIFLNYDFSTIDTAIGLSLHYFQGQSSFLGKDSIYLH